MSKRKGTPDWDRGGGWKTVKAEWQDFEKAADKTVTPEQLKEMWCPATGSTISIDMGHILDGLILQMNVGLKEYNKPTPESKTKTRKPTTLSANIENATGIPMPGCPLGQPGGSWWEKKTWSSAVKTMLNEIIPAYESNSAAVRMWSVVHRAGVGVS